MKPTKTRWFIYTSCPTKDLCLTSASSFKIKLLRRKTDGPSPDIFVKQSPSWLRIREKAAKPQLGDQLRTSKPAPTGISKGKPWNCHRVIWKYYAAWVEAAFNTQMQQEASSMHGRQLTAGSSGEKPNTSCGYKPQLDEY